MVTVAVDPFWTLALALLLDAAIGRPDWLARPIAGVRQFIAGLVDTADKRLNRPNRSDGDRRIRGAVALAILAGAAYLVGATLDGWLAGGASLFKAALLALFFAQRTGVDLARRLTDGAPEAADPHKAARQGVAGLAIRLGEDIVGPALAYALFGLGGLFVYAVILLAAARLDPRDAEKQAFGTVPNLLARYLCLSAAIPAALMIVAAAAFSPGASPARALAGLWRGDKALPNGRPGLALGALAGAFGFSFEGQDGWIGDGRARLDAPDVRRALYIFIVACLIHLTFWATLGFVTAG